MISTLTKNLIFILFSFAPRWYSTDYTSFSYEYQCINYLKAVIMVNLHQIVAFTFTPENLMCVFKIHEGTSVHEHTYYGPVYNHSLLYAKLSVLVHISCGFHTTVQRLTRVFCATKLRRKYRAKCILNKVVHLIAKFKITYNYLVLHKILGKDLKAI